MILGHCSEKQNAEANQICRNSNVLESLGLVLLVGVDAKQVSFVRLGRVVRHVVRAGRSVMTVSVIVSSSTKISADNRLGVRSKLGGAQALKYSTCSQHIFCQITRLDCKAHADLLIVNSELCCKRAQSC